MVDETQEITTQGTEMLEAEAKDQTMAEIMAEYEGAEIHRGKVVEGKVVDARDDGWLVDVGYKCEGFLPRKEWTHHMLVEEMEEPKVGDKVRVQVTNIGQGEDAQLSLSRWRSEFDERWDRLEKELGEGELITVKGLRKVKGGLIVDCFGLEGFIPISHLTEERRAVNQGQLVDQTFAVKLLEKDRRKRRLVWSRRSILEEEMNTAREQFYNSVNEGDVLEGDVSSVTSFGVFVNLGTIEGLVHVSELTWQRNAKIRDIVSRGDHVKVKVIGIDRENNRISLSLRQTMEDPWSDVSARWALQSKTVGKVTNLTDFGAFVEIEPGIEGLIHIGDLSWSRIRHPRDVLKKGQDVEVVVLEIDTERRRISLGYKQIHDPWLEVTAKYAKDQNVDVKVVRLADFGAFVELEESIEGLIHISQLSRQRVEKPQDVLQEGQIVTARIMEVNPQERRIRLSLRALQDEEEYKKRDEERKQRRRTQETPRPAQKDPTQTEEVSVTIGDLLREQEGLKDF